MGCYPSTAVHKLGPDSAPPSPEPPTCCGPARHRPMGDSNTSQQCVEPTKQANGWVDGPNAPLTPEKQLRAQAWEDGVDGEAATPGGESDKIVSGAETPGRGEEGPAAAPPGQMEEMKTPVKESVEQPTPAVMAESPSILAKDNSTIQAEPLPVVAKPKYGASIPVGGKFVPVGSSPVVAPTASKIDFAAEKAKIEAEFTELEEQLDSGARDRADIERDFDILTNKAATLRRLQEADAAANRAQMAQNRPAQLAPVRVAQLSAPRDPSIPSMAVVHWKGVTKPQYLEYKEKLLAKYGSGKEIFKSVEKIPNRILITAPNPEVMSKVLADEELDPRPEAYKLPTRAAPLPAVQKPPAKQEAPAVGSLGGSLPPNPLANNLAAPKAPLAPLATLAPIGQQVDPPAPPAVAL